MDKEFLTPEEVAARLKVGVRTVGEWIRKGQLRGVKLGNRWRVHQEDMDMFVQMNTSRPELAEYWESSMTAYEENQRTVFVLVDGKGFLWYIQPSGLTPVAWINNDNLHVCRPGYARDSNSISMELTSAVPISEIEDIYALPCQLSRGVEFPEVHLWEPHRLAFSVNFLLHHVPPGWIASDDRQTLVEIERELPRWREEAPPRSNNFDYDGLKEAAQMVRKIHDRVLKGRL